jgi:hypothetical protein
VKAAESAKLLAAGAIWRFTGAAAAGRSLIEGLTSPDETARTIAGILLVKTGSRSVNLIRDAIGKAREQSLPMLLRIAGEFGDDQLDEMLARYTASENSEIAQAARDAQANSKFARQDREKR